METKYSLWLHSIGILSAKVKLFFKWRSSSGTIFQSKVNDILSSRTVAKKMVHMSAFESELRVENTGKLKRGEEEICFDLWGSS